MKVMVIGATGRTGRQLARQALEAGHEVTAFARHPAKLEIEHELLRAVAGDVRDLEAVTRAVAGQDAVISALGPTGSSAGDVMNTGARNVVRAMEAQGVARLIWLTGAGVEVEGDQPSFLRKVVQGLLKVVSPAVLQDSARAYEVIAESELGWTVVRVPRLKDGPAEGGYRATFKPPGPRALSRADVAAFMLEQLTSDGYVQQAPMLTR